MEAEIQDGRSVIVTNISPSANEKTVSDFFSFCGKIAKLYLKKEEGKDTSAAVIQFETESAAKTALLLTNALIVDRPITVTQFTNTTSSTSTSAPTPVPQENLGTPVSAENITQRDFGNVHDDDRSKTSVVASLLAQGYMLANDALDKAKELDEKSNFSAKAMNAVEQLKVKVQNIDVQYGITDKANAVKTSIEVQVKKIDQELHISERASQAAQTIKAATQVGVQKVQNLTGSMKEGVNEKITQAQENPTVKKATETVKTTAQKVGQSVSTTFNDVRDQTNKAIEAKKQEKRERSMSGSAPAEVAEAPAPTSDPVVQPTTQ